MSKEEVEARLRAMPETEKAAMRDAVERQVAAFAAFFEAMGNGALSRPEAALLRTYLTAVATGLLPSDRPAP